MLLIGHDFPPDIRVEKEIPSLVAAGYAVLLACENRKDRPSHEAWKDARVLRLPNLPRWARAISTATLFLTHHQLLWEREIASIIRDERPDVLHVHDLPFVGPALRIARNFGLPVVADLHENYPGLLKIRRASNLKRSFLDPFIFSPERFTRYEKQILPQCEKIIVVVEEAAARLRDIGIPAEKIIIVGNTEDVQSLEANHIQEISLPESALKLLYVGGFGIHRGLETVIQAMPKLCQHVPSARFSIVGDGPERHLLEQLAHQLNIAHAIQFEGRQPFEKVHSYIKQSDICLVPHLANPHTNATMPHKLFQYMFGKKAVIVSSAEPLKRVVEETQCGLVFESGNSDRFVECVLQMQDAETRDRMGNNGYQAVLQKYNWQNDAKSLTRLYGRLANKKAP